MRNLFLIIFIVTLLIPSAHKAEAKINEAMLKCTTTVPAQLFYDEGETFYDVQSNYTDFYQIIKVDYYHKINQFSFTENSKGQIIAKKYTYPLFEDGSRYLVWQTDRYVLYYKLDRQTLMMQYENKGGYGSTWKCNLLDKNTPIERHIEEYREYLVGLRNDQLRKNKL